MDAKNSYKSKNRDILLIFTLDKLKIHRFIRRSNENYLPKNQFFKAIQKRY